MMAGAVTCPVCVSVFHTFSNAPASPEEEKEEDVEKEFILYITSEARLSLSSTAYNT